MLTHIYIKQFTIVSECEIALHSGMTIITGETGAGKSILFDALQLALGGRGDSKLIAQGTKKCEITAQFDVQHIPSAKQWLIDQTLDCDNECILRRTLDNNGRSQSFINGKASPLTQTRELASLLVDIHGQHENQSLLKNDKQLATLDEYAGHHLLLAQLQKNYQQWSKVTEELNRLQQTSDQSTKLSLLNYQIQELDDLALEQNEIEALEKKFKRLSNAETVLSSCQAALDSIAENEQVNVMQLLSKTKLQLQPLLNTHEKIANSYDLLSQAEMLSQEAHDELHHYHNHIELNPEAMHKIEQRLQSIYDLARKHHIQPEGLYELHHQLQQALKQLTDSESHCTILQEKMITLEKQYQQLAEKLSIGRQRAAKKLAAQILHHLKQLALEQSQFIIDFQPRSSDKPHPKGAEKIEFLISTNPGQAPQALNKIASGGELSRISLAIQVITAQKEATPTLLFDEVDVGISGATAEIVGKLLNQLGKAAQVICITHLAQVAAQGHHHLLVTKQSDKHSTDTKIEQLNDKDKIKEIARLVGGVTITNKSLAHAKELLEARLQ